MAESFAAIITLTGVKNPTFIGTTGVNDVKIQSFHPTNNYSYLINEGFFNTLTYKDKKNVDTLFFKINLTSYYQEVSSDYEFVLQNTNRLPPKGTINIVLPKLWVKDHIGKLKIL